jgi:DNA polymerase-3 subunit beta
MEAAAPRATWLSALGHASKIADPKSAYPACHRVQLTVEGGRLRARATDLMRFYEGTRPLTASRPGGCCVDAHLLEKVLKAMPDEGEVILRDERQTLSVAHSTSRRKCSRIGTVPAEDHPSHPEATGEPRVLALATLHHILRLTGFAQSSDNARPHLNGLCLDWSGTTLQVVATDGHRLALAHVEAPSANATTIIPRPAVELLQKLPDEGEVTLAISRDHARWSVGDDQWMTKTVDADFPSWRQVVPSAHDGVVRCNRAALLASLRSVSTMTSDRSNGVRLEPGDEGLTIRSSDPETGEMEDSIPFECEGKLPAAWGVNAAYLIDVLNACTGDSIELQLTGELDPMRVHDPSLGDAAVDVIMPMRV